MLGADICREVEEDKKSRLGLLERNEGDLRRDGGAENSIISSWQISFEHIREIRRSAADLLSLMSCFDPQAIPEALLKDNGPEIGKHAASRAEQDCEAADGENGDRSDESSDNDSGSSIDSVETLTDAGDEEFEDDILMLRGYSLISLTTDSTDFKMHRLVQLATQKWLEMDGHLDHWRSQFITNLHRGFPAGSFENWTICQPLFPHAMIALDVKLADQGASLRQASLLFKGGWYASEQGVT